ncbi:hypothetical protein K8I28_07460 [bacterium]|nr:hypothetical protein [bacterium]
MNQSRVFSFIILLVLVSTTIIFSGCRDSEYDSQWNDFAITIDGKFQDWDNVTRYTNAEFRTAVGMVNDDEMLYLLVLRKDLDAQVAQGVNLWIEPDGKAKNRINIRYYGKPPATVKSDPKMKLSVSSYRDEYDIESDSSRAELGGIWDMILFQKLKEERPSLVAPNGADGPRAAFSNLPGNVRAYEFAIPLKDFSKGKYAMPFGAGDKFKFGFEFVSKYSMVWGNTMWEWHGNNLVRTYYVTNAPVITDVYVFHEPEWVTVNLARNAKK